MLIIWQTHLEGKSIRNILFSKTLQNSAIISTNGIIPPQPLINQQPKQIPMKEKTKKQQ